MFFRYRHKSNRYFCRTAMEFLVVNENAKLGLRSSDRPAIESFVWVYPRIFFLIKERGGSFGIPLKTHLERYVPTHDLSLQVCKMYYCPKAKYFLWLHMLHLVWSSLLLQREPKCRNIVPKQEKNLFQFVV